VTIYQLNNFMKIKHFLIKVIYRIYYNLLVIMILLADVIFQELMMLIKQFLYVCKVNIYSLNFL